MGENQPARDYYEVLGIDPRASAAEVRRAFRRLAIRHHPDNNPGDEPAAERRFQELLEAFEVLSEAFTRRWYDYVRGDRTVRFSPQDLARLGLASAAAGEGAGGQLGQPARPRVARPARVAAATAVLGFGAIPLAALWPVAALLCGVGALALASLALCSVGTVALSVRAARLAEVGRAGAVVALALAGVRWAGQTGAILAEYVVGDGAWAGRGLWDSWAASLAWLGAGGAVALWVGASRVRFSREAKRWREYRFVMIMLLAGVFYGLAAGQIAAGVSPEHVYYTHLGPQSLSDGRTPDGLAAHAMALADGADYAWKVGLSLALAALLANSPHRFAPTLPYAGMLRRVAPAWACVGGLALLVALMGAGGLLGEVFRGHLVPRANRPSGVMAVYGMRVGELAGVLISIPLIVFAVVAERKAVARQLRAGQLTRSRPLLPGARA
jgi:hypothetical protein